MLSLYIPSLWWLPTAQHSLSMCILRSLWFQLYFREKLGIFLFQFLVTLLNGIWFGVASGRVAFSWLILIQVGIRYLPSGTVRDLFEIIILLQNGKSEKAKNVMDRLRTQLGRAQFLPRHLGLGQLQLRKCLVHFQLDQVIIIWTKLVRLTKNEV